MIPTFSENIKWKDFETSGSEASSTGGRKGRMLSKMQGVSILAEAESSFLCLVTGDFSEDIMIIFII